MAGAPDWQQLTATLPSIAAVGAAQTEAADIAAGASEQIMIAAAPGSVARLTAWSNNGIPIPPGATSGNHQLQINTPNGVALVFGQSDYNATQSAIEFNGGFWQAAGTAQWPAAGTNQSWWAGTQYCTATAAFTLYYFNNTNVTQTNSRQYFWQLVQEDLP